MPSIRMHWKDLSFSRVREEIDYITIVLISLVYIHVRVSDVVITLLCHLGALQLPGTTPVRPVAMFGTLRQAYGICRGLVSLRHFC